MKLWKLLGLAGAVGVAASGVVVVRAERVRAAYTPDEVRDVLHRRLTEAGEQSPTTQTRKPRRFSPKR